MRYTAWMDPKFIDDLAQRLSRTVPDGIRIIQQDIEQNFKAVLQSGLSKLDLVTREEFEVQAGVLERTREKLGALTERIQTLEASLSKDPGSQTES